MCIRDMEIGKIAKQANGAVLVRYGDTAVVVAVTGTKTPREGDVYKRQISW